MRCRRATAAGARVDRRGARACRHRRVFIFCARIAGEQSTAEQTSPAPVWNVPPGWYHPPSGGRLLYWWDGQAWTEHTKPAPDPGQPRP
ncbi:DUF2510 domain-containing protein [Nocardia brasiliensis]|uniref:DUF2510 domain-containing protein n=1 Tax=Nocardia brasiliensis TaxID=37326 RepID=UPI003D7889B2